MTDAPGGCDAVGIRNFCRLGGVSRMQYIYIYFFSLSFSGILVCVAEGIYKIAGEPNTDILIIAVY